MLKEMEPRAERIGLRLKNYNCYKFSRVQWGCTCETLKMMNLAEWSIKFTINYNHNLKAFIVSLCLLRPNERLEISLKALLRMALQLKTSLKRQNYQRLWILHGITLKFQGWREVGNVWAVGNVRCEVTTGREGA